MVRRCTRWNEASCSAATSNGRAAPPTMLSKANRNERNANCKP